MSSSNPLRDLHGTRSRPPAYQTSMQQRSIEDGPANQASPEVISNLLASLSSISLPADSHRLPVTPFTAPPPPLRVSSRRPSRTHSPRRLDPRDPSLDFERPHRPPLPILEAIHPDHGAEPPVVRTSRRPSGQSRHTGQTRDTRPRTSQSDRPQFGKGPPLPPPRVASSRTESEDQHRPLPKLLDDFKKHRINNDSSARSSVDSQRPNRSMGSRDSLQILRSKESKKRERAGTASPSVGDPASLRGYQPFNPNSVPRSPNPGPNRPLNEYSSALSIHSIIEDAEFGEAGSSRHPRRLPSQDSFVIVHDDTRTARPETPSQRRILAGSDGQARPGSSDGLNFNFIPSRTSSLRLISSSPTRLNRSRRPSVQRLPDSFQEEQSDLQKTTQTTIDTSEESKDEDLDEDNDVMRRIKELRAAKEERQKISTELPREDMMGVGGFPGLPPTERVPPSAFQAPDTTDAIEQLREAMKVEAHTETLIPFENAQSASRPSTAAYSAPASPFITSPRSPNFSRTIPVFASNVASPPRTPNEPSTSPWGPSPFMSQPTSDSKHLAASDMPPRPGYARHSREMSRGHEKVAFALYPPITERDERRSSLDSVSQSIREYLSSPQLSRKIPSHEGRRQISFSEVGDPKGYPVFVCIGMGVTRYATAYYEELATSLKLRLITPERPGIGDSGVYDQHRPPLHWPEDVKDICRYLRIEEFSLLAHSAGAIYAMATAIKLAGHVKCKIHLLAPWIPPSQMSQKSGISKTDTKATGLPRSQRFLRLVPTSFLKLTNNNFMAGAARPKSPGSKGRRSGGESAFTSPRPSMGGRGTGYATPNPPIPLLSRRGSWDRVDIYPPSPAMVSPTSDGSIAAAVLSAGYRFDGNSTPSRTSEDPGARQRRYDHVLTQDIYDLATRTGGAHIDLAICLEKSQPIGFRYADVSHEVVIHHGTNDNRVPLHNIKWLCRVMQKAELKVLDGENHNLMSSAGVMAQVLTDVAREWEAGLSGALNDASSYHSPLLG